MHTSHTRNVLKRTKFATEVPSSLMSLRNYKKLQRDPHERILDDHPEPDRNIPPIPLLYWDGCDDVHRLADVEVAMQ